MKKIMLVIALLSTWSFGEIKAQEFDLNTPGIEDLYFDWVGKAPASDRVGVYRDITYWNMFAMRMKGWNGGNDCTSVSLPDGNTLWTFGDSYFGRISEFRDRMQYNNRPHNAAQVQIQGGEWYGEDDFVTLNEIICTNQNNPNLYYKGRAWTRHPKATLDEASLAKGLIDQDYYLRPQDGTVVLSSGQTHLQMLFASFNSKDERDGTYLAEFAIEGDPRDPAYCYLLSMKQLPYVIDFGSSILEDGGRNYLYGSAVNRTGSRIVCARTEGRSLDGPWEYYVKNDAGEMEWTKTIPTQEQLINSKINGSQKCYGASVFKYGDKYYMVSQTSTGGAIQMAEGDNPWGPFNVQKVLYNVRKDEAVVNRVFVHPQLSRLGELVLSYTTEPEETTIVTKGANGEAVVTTLDTDQRNRTGWGSASLNQPHFLRVFNWQKMFNVAIDGPITDSMLSEWNCADGIGDVADEELHESATYNLAGQKVGKGYKGIVITNGRKVVK